VVSTGVPSDATPGVSSAVAATRAEHLLHFTSSDI